ncbi:MAG: hypothetical protein JWN80_394, partial [Microbacteriaceae bacterium]|nr:hypothetical protein [Microbacteriaceae bacterium]
EPDSASDVPRFVEDHHELVEESTSRDVSGRVAEIFAVSNRLVPVPGSPHMINDQSTVNEERIEKAERFHSAPGGFVSMGFRVILEIDRTTELPEYVEPPWKAEHRDRERSAVAEAAAYRDSDVGRRLAQLCNRIADEFSGRVDVRSERTGVTIQPLGANRCAVMWMHSPNGISLLVGDGTWSLAGTVQGVVELERFLAAASRGDVRERVFRNGFATIVMEGDSELAREEVEFTLQPGRSGYGSVTESDRRRRGDVDYEPW